MKMKIASDLAIAALSKPEDVSSLAEKYGVSSKFVDKTKNRLVGLGYLAFSHPHLDIAVAALGLKSKLTVVQVGANDGKTGDPIFELVQKYAERIMLIEPIPELIAGLERNYAQFSGRKIIENIAVGRSEGEFRLYRLKPALWDEYIAKVGRHPTAISSFEGQAILKKVMRRLNLDRAAASEAIEQLVCPMLPLSALIEKHGFKDVDLLQIDCEGYDYQVIESLGEYRPAIINFESFNLTPDHWAKWKEWAQANGYGYVQGRHDTLAIRGGDFALEY